MKNATLCRALMAADTEAEVIEILSKNGFWDSPAEWRFLGDDEGAFATVGNQQSRAEAAIVEKLVNSIDARLTNACLEADINPASDAAPATIRGAVATFFDHGSTSSTAGRVQEWPNKKRTSEAKLVSLAATGQTPPGYPCLSIADKGEGQVPDAFPETFLSLHRQNKMRIPFVQGKFNMGGTGALQFCGRTNLQLVVSRRNPALLPTGSSERDLEWGFTIVRREDPAEGRRSSVYTYLAPVGSDESPGKGDVLSFAAATMPIFPEERDPYSRPSEWGTLIKLYEYEMRGFASNIITSRNGLLRRLDLLLPEIALPIRLYECRKSYRGKKGSFETNVAGVSVRLTDDRAENLEPDFPTSATITTAGESMDVTIYVFKKGAAQTYKTREGILFTINGQTHANISTDFFRRTNVGLSYLRESLFVMVDCSGISGRAREDLFMNSRDRLRSSELRDDIERQLEHLLRGHDGLRDLVNQRRQKEIEAKLEDSASLEDALKALLERSPILRTLLLKGKQIPNPFAPKRTAHGDVDYEGKPHPSVFKFKDVPYGDVLERDAFVGQRVRIRFETDVENEYFAREVDRGSFKLTAHSGDGPVTVKGYSLNLHNGIASLNVELPEKAEPGNVLEWTTEVIDPTLIDPFVNVVRLEVKGAKASNGGGKGNGPKPPVEKKGTDREVPSLLALPKIVPIDEDQWADQDPPFDKFTALRITHAGSEGNGDKSETYDFKVNVDNIFLKAEQKQRSQPTELVQAQFIQGLVLVGLAILQDDKKTRAEAPEDLPAEEDGAPNVEDLVERLSRAVAPVLLPMIDSLAALEMDDP